MALQINSYDRDRHTEGLVDLFNQQTADEPYIVPLSAERFAQWVAGKTYFDAAGLLVAEQGGQVGGWVHGCVVPYTEGAVLSGPAYPRIEMLLFREDLPAVGKQLVAESTKWLAARSTETITAIHPHKGYPFYRAFWLGGEPQCPLTLTHVQMALASSGYEQTHQDVMMVCEMTEQPTVCRADVDAEFCRGPSTLKHEVASESWAGFAPQTITAMIDETWVGHIGYVVVPQAAERLGAAQVNIYTLGVAEMYRRRGLASALVSRVQAAGYEQGAKFSSVCTELWNVAGQVTYAKFGYRPYCIVNGRTLRESAQESK